MDVWVYLGIAVLCVLFLTGSPIAVAFGLGGSIIALGTMHIPFVGLSEVFFSAVNSYPLLAVPFFILAGYLLIKTGAMEPLQELMQDWFGSLPGGHAVATLIFAAFLGAISGSSSACAAVLASVALPVLLQAGYDRPFCSGMITTAGEVGLLIPPSIMLIIFGAYNQISIADLFLGGIGSGLLMIALMIGVVLLRSRKRKYPTGAAASWKKRSASLIKALPALFLPLVILGGIYGGIFTPTQSAAIACFVALALGFLVYRKLTWAGVMAAAVDTAKISSMVYLLVIAADIMGMMFAFIQLPQHICELVIAMHLGPLSFLLMVEVLLLAMGFVFSSFPMVIVVLPLFLPSVIKLGIDPVFYGVLAIMDAMIGEITPPVGLQLWIASALCKESVENTIREAWPFLVAMTLAMVICTFVPSIIMFPVNLYR